MSDKERLLKELEETFKKSQKDLGFNSSFEDLEKAFGIKDSILSVDFVSENFSRQLCSRILENYMGWYTYLNGLLVPNPNYLASQTESKVFGDEESRKNIWKLIKKIMEFSTRHSLIGFDSGEDEAKFIDEGLDYWNTTFKPNLVGILTKVNQGWQRE